MSDVEGGIPPVQPFGQPEEQPPEPERRASANGSRSPSGPAGSLRLS